MACPTDAVLKFLFTGAVLGALPGAALANIGAAWLRKRLGVSPKSVKNVDDTGDADGDQ